MDKINLAHMIFYKYYKKYHKKNNYPKIRSITNENTSPRVHLESFQVEGLHNIEREIHINANSIRLNYFFPDETAQYYFQTIWNYNDDIVYKKIGNNYYKFSCNDSGTIECHLKFQSDNGQPDENSESVKLLNLDYQWQDLESSDQRLHNLVDAIVSRWGEMALEIDAFLNSN